VLSEKGVSTSPDKVTTVRDYPTSKNVKDFRAFLGPASFYGRLVKDFSTIAKPLTDLTKKDLPFCGVLVNRKSFRALRINCVQRPCCHTLIFELRFILTTDASKIAVAAILSQEQNDVERPIPYVSRQMNKVEQAYKLPKRNY